MYPGWHSGIPKCRPRERPPAANDPACVQDRAAWCRYVSDFCALSIYQPVCVVILTGVKAHPVRLFVDIYRKPLSLGRFPRSLTESLARISAQLCRMGTDGRVVQKQGVSLLDSYQKPWRHVRNGCPLRSPAQCILIGMFGSRPSETRDVEARSEVNWRRSVFRESNRARSECIRVSINIPTSW